MLPRVLAVLVVAVLVVAVLVVAVLVVAVLVVAVRQSVAAAVAVAESFRPSTGPLRHWMTQLRLAQHN
jgi:predicted PurR-regulated permease PerM